MHGDVADIYKTIHALTNHCCCEILLLLVLIFKNLQDARCYGNPDPDRKRRGGTFVLITFFTLAIERSKAYVKNCVRLT